MPSRRSVLAATAALSSGLTGCSSLPRLRTPAGTDWHAQVPEPGLLAPPVATDGFVATAGRHSNNLEDGRVVVFDAETGDRQWQRDLGRPTGLAAAAGAVYVGEKRAGRARILAFDAPTGEQRWTRTVGNLASAMTVADGTLYAANGTLAALDTADGTIRWERSSVDGTGFTVVAAPENQLGADAQAVYYGDQHGVIALADDGSSVWTWRPDQWDWTDVGPAPVDDTVFVGGGGDVVVLDRETGAARWRTSFGRQAQVTGVHGAAGSSSLLVAEGTDRAPSDLFGTVYGLSLRDGHERYEMRFDTPVVRTASTAETFVVGTRGGRIVWTDGASFFGRSETTVPGDGFVLGAAEGRAFVQSSEGTLWALSPPE